ncbi:MAG: hypothetical protein IJH37_13280 [Clostridia bacterium]|nr:hypothetical protein [Clostridia bacterium]
MQKIKPLYRNIILVFSYLFLMSVFFFIGLTAGSSRSAPDADQTMAAVSIPSQYPTELPEKYRVILEDNELRLYHDENGISRLISSEDISEGSYPVRDIAILKDGVSFDTSEAALTLMENFIS